MEFERKREARAIIMDQKSYIEEILKHFNMEEYKWIQTPFDEDLKLLKILDEEIGNVQTKTKGVP